MFIVTKLLKLSLLHHQIMSKIQFKVQKNFTIRPSGRSSDYISPAFGRNCSYGCHYCTCRRFNQDKPIFFINTDEILHAINSHTQLINFTGECIKPNQTHEKLISYDISCQEDFALHRKFHPWEKIFNFFKNHPNAMGTLATKCVPVEFLNYNPEGKIRIRFSLMPQKISSILEPNTAKIIDRIKAINPFIEAGYDVHVNFSPVVVYKEWKEDYTELFNMLDDYVEPLYKKDVKAEVIFLTHNELLHNHNVEKGIKGEDLLWQPKYQEVKTSQYGGKNLRYKVPLKRIAIGSFKKMYQQHLSNFGEIRYIF